MAKNNNDKSKYALFAETLNISMESAEKLVDANFTIEGAKKFLDMDEYDVSALCYKIVCEEEKHCREGNPLYDPDRKSTAEGIHNLFNEDRTPKIRDSKDKLLFKKAFGTTNLGYDEDEEEEKDESEFVTAEILINGEPFLDIVRQCDEYHYE